MKKLLYCIIVLLPLFLFQCSTMPQTPSTTEIQSKSVLLAISTYPEFDTIANYAQVHVSGHGMDTITEFLTILDSSITGKVNNIPVGNNRHFEVYVYGYAGDVIYYGDSYADIRIGEETYVYIGLKRPTGGSAVINGTIIDYPTYNEYISISQPYLQLRDTLDGHLSIAIGVWASSSLNHQLEYSWIIYGIGDSGEIYVDWNSYSDQLNFIIPKDCDIYAYASVRCYSHQHISVSDSVKYMFRNGKFVSDSLYIPTTPETYYDTTIVKLAAGDSSYFLKLEAGDNIQITVNGYWCMERNLCCGPDGDSIAGTNQYKYPSFSAGALLGRMNNEVFLIGSGTNIVTQTGGYLELFPNEPNKRGQFSGMMEITILK